MCALRPRLPPRPWPPLPLLPPPPRHGHSRIGEDGTEGAGEGRAERGEGLVVAHGAGAGWLLLLLLFCGCYGGVATVRRRRGEQSRQQRVEEKKRGAGERGRSAPVTMVTAAGPAGQAGHAGRHHQTTAACGACPAARPPGCLPARARAKRWGRLRTLPAALDSRPRDVDLGSGVLGAPNRTRGRARPVQRRRTFAQRRDSMHRRRLHV